MHMKLVIISALASCCMGCTGTTYVRTSGAPTVVSTSTTVAPSINADQTANIRAYVSSVSSANNSRGRGRNGGLPPGIARNLERGKPLPPGIAKQYLPPELTVTLPRLENGLEYVIVAGKLLVVEIATQIVRDVLIDVLFD
jgi:hypothetical protein